jgi:hypothetical protein
MPSATTATHQLIRDEAAVFLGRNPSEEEWEEALPRAERKLARIINREGDADGARLQPWYLGKLVEEAIREEAFSQFTFMHCAVIAAQRQVADQLEEIEKAAPSRDDPTTPTLYYPDMRFVNPLNNQ